MELLMKEKYSKAYSEVLSIIKHMGIEYEKKIPQNLLQLFEDNKDKDYQYNIDNTKKLKDQKLLDETLGLLSFIELEYWATPEEKELLNKALQDNEIEYKNRTNEICDSDILIKNENFNEEEQNEDEVGLIEYKESIFKKIINKIKEFFHIY